MDAKETGGPAFPNYLKMLPQDGMTLHDYFMAHAPVIPHDWFLPEMLRDCPIVPSINAVSNPAWRADLKLQAEWAEGEQSQAARQWFDRQEQATEEQAAWQAEFRKQRSVQWPAAWADAMLEQRK